MATAGWALLVVEGLWLVTVGIVWPILAAVKTVDASESRALSLPRGSVRAILALVIVGSFVIFLVFMPFLDDLEHLDKALVAFGTLSGAVTGFYFGGRTASPPPT